MNVGDVFHIKGRGTVVTGLLEGNGDLRVGDALVCEGQHWPVSAIEAFRATLQVAEPGLNIGVMLRTGPPGDVLRGRLVQFVPGPKNLGPPPGLRKKRWRRGG
jgi:translation elongation factor EF-Tu-like GTPase